MKGLIESLSDIQRLVNHKFWMSDKEKKQVVSILMTAQHSIEEVFNEANKTKQADEATAQEQTQEETQKESSSTSEGETDGFKVVKRN